MASTFISLPSAEITGPIDVNINPINDAIKISDGTDTLAVNTDGSINVAGVFSGNTVPVGVNEFEYGEALNVAIGASATVVTKFFLTDYKLRRASCTGENIAVFTILFNGTPVDKSRSTYSDFNCRFDYETGITIPAGTTVTVEVLNSGNSIADFSAQLLFSAI